MIGCKWRNTSAGSVNCTGPKGNKAGYTVREKEKKIPTVRYRALNARGKVALFELSATL
jgi:hypothetical protein